MIARFQTASEPHPRFAVRLREQHAVVHIPLQTALRIGFRRHKSPEAQPVLFQRQRRNGGKRVRRIFGAGLEITFRFLKQQPRLLLRQRCLRQTLHIGAHAVQIGHHAAVHLGKHAAFPPFAGDFGGSLKSRFRICAACEHDDLPVQLRLARFVGGNQQRVGLLLGG